MPKVEPEEHGAVAKAWAEVTGDLVIDVAAVAAIEPKSDGRYALHLAGGQTIRLDALATIAVLKQLGLTAVAGRLAKQHAQRLKTGPKAPRVKRAKAEAKPPTLWQEFVGLFSP